MSIRIIEDETLHIDPQEHVIERYGHARYYTTHECPKCENRVECKVPLCRLESTIECLPCLTRELLEDTERFAKEAREFLKDASTPELMWKASVIDGKLKGLAERAKEVAKRQDSEVKSEPDILAVLKSGIPDGRLQTFQDRERWRAEARAAIAKAEEKSEKH